MVFEDMVSSYGGFNYWKHKVDIGVDIYHYLSCNLR
jgi:hypothetical protein